MDGPSVGIPSYAEPRAVEVRRLVAVIAATMSAVPFDSSGNVTVAADELLYRMCALGHPRGNIEWAVYYAVKRGYLISATIIESVQPTPKRYTAQIKKVEVAKPSLTATALFWSDWRSGLLSFEAGHKSVDRPDITLALSGGGLRATLFQLGAFLAIVHFRGASSVKGVVSVSGGSILAAHLAKCWDRVVATDEERTRVFGELVTFARSDIRNRIFVPWLWGLLWPINWFSIFGKKRARSRSARLTTIYQQFFGPVYLGDLASSTIPRVAFVSTDAIRRDRVVFTCDKILRLAITHSSSSPKEPVVTLGSGAPMSLAVAASSCLPLVFNRMYVDFNDLSLNFSEFQESLALSDGGVSGNLGIHALLSITAMSGLDGQYIVSIDAERPQTSKPWNWSKSDMDAQGAAVSQAERDEFARVVRENGVIVRLADRLPATPRLSFQAQTLLSRFRTDLDAPSWDECYGLMIYGAYAASSKIGQQDWVTHADDLHHDVARILTAAGCSEAPQKVNEETLANSGWRPIRRIVLHLFLMMGSLIAAVCGFTLFISVILHLFEILQ